MFQNASISTFIAFRHLTSGRSNRFFSWIASLSILGVAIGVATMIVVLSVINGFETELRKRFLNANAHVLAFRYPDGLTNPNEMAKQIRQDFKNEVTGVSPFVHYETMIKRDHILHSVLVRGFIPKLREKVQSLRTSIQPESALDQIQSEYEDIVAGKTIPETPSVIVGEGVLKLIEAQVGDLISLVSPNSENFGDLHRFKVIGVYHSGLKHYDNRLIALALPVAQDFFQMKGRVTGLEIGLFDPDKSPEIASQMNDKYQLSIREWQSFNKPIMEALKMERVLIFFVVFLVAFVAGFNILTTLFVAVTQKQRDISVLKALGARNGQIVALFLKQGFLFGFVGSMIGCFLALCISILIEHYQFIDLPDPYYLKNLPVLYDWKIYATMAGIGIVICIIASVIPAVTAMRVPPTVGFKGIGKIA